MSAGPLSMLGRTDSPILRRSVFDDVTGAPVLSADALATMPDPNAVVERSTFLPLGVTASGRVVPASQAAIHTLGRGLIGDLPGAGIGEALHQFNQVAYGREPLFDPTTGHVSDKNIGAVGTLAGATAGLSSLAPVEAGAARVFGGVQSRTADYDSLWKAMKQQDKGVHPDDIWRSTGWGRFPDGQWRYEIPDNTASLTPAQNAPPGMFRYEHEGIKAAYPELWNRVEQRIYESPGYGGMFDDPTLHAFGPNDLQRRSATAHEFQHAIQEQEGFGRGGAPSMFTPPEGSNMTPQQVSDWQYGQYRRLAGEVEANAVQARLNLTPEERRHQPPWVKDFEYSADQQVLHFAPSRPAASLGDMSFDDLLASMGSAIDSSKLTLEPPTPGPRRLDPNAKAWDVYHGATPGPDFQRFDPSLANNPAERGAVFFAPDPETAANYAGRPTEGAEAGSRVFRATVDPGKTGVFDLSHLAETDPAFNARARELTVRDSTPGYGSLHDNYMDTYRARREGDRDIARQVAEMGYPASHDPSGNISYGWGHIGAAIERAQAQGLDTAILRNLAEHGGDDQVIALTPGRVRSFYDPSQVLYSGGPAGAVTGLGGLALPYDRQ